MAIAHATIEDPRDGTKYYRGDSVPDDLPGLKELTKFGSVKDEDYDPDAEPKLVPDEVVIDGIVYKKSSDTVENGDASVR